MQDFSVETRQAILLAMKANAGIIGLVPAARIFPAFVPGVPIFPFMRMGPPAAVPFSASCLNGQSLLIAIHCWAKGGDENAAAINKAVMALFGGASDRDSGYALDIGAGAEAYLYISGAQILQDPDETSAYHGIVDCQIDVLA